MSERSDQVAEAIRVWSLDALDGDAEKDAELARRAASAAIALASGEWESLSRAEPVDAQIRPRLRLLVQTTVRAVAPLGIVIALRTFDILGADSSTNYLLVASVAWLFVTFLIQYDPLFEAKLGALGKLPGLPGRKDE